MDGETPLPSDPDALDFGRPRRVVPFLAALIGIALAAASALIAWRTSTQVATARFERDLSRLTTLLHHELDVSEHAVGALAGLYDSSEKVTKEEFSGFASALLRRTKTLFAIAWVERISPAKRLALESGPERFVVVDIDATGRRTRALERPEHYAVREIEPRGSSGFLVGVDFGGESKRRSTLELARDLGQPRASLPLRLWQEREDEWGILLMWPVYTPGALARTVDERRQALRGLVSGAVRLGDVARGVIADLKLRDAWLCLEDVDVGGRERILHEEGKRPVSGGIERTSTLQIAGRRWHLHFGAPLAANTLPAIVIFAGGVLFSIAVGAYLFARGRNEALLRRSRETLTRTAEFRERFIGVVSHELRNPLATISLAAQLLGRDRELPPNAQEAAKRITSASRRMQRIIADLLDFTRARLGGGLTIQRRAMDAGLLCQQLVKEMRAAWPGRELVCETRGSLVGYWDPDRLAQVVTNLLQNALKHGVDGAPVSIEVRDEDKDIAIEVHNEGVVSDAILERTFEPFHETSARDGLGLGLFIVNEVVRAHGGEVRVASSVEAGTTFCVALPRGEGPGSRPPASDSFSRGISRSGTYATVSAPAESPPSSRPPPAAQPLTEPPQA